MNIPLLVLVVYFATLGLITWYALKMQRSGGSAMLNYLLAGKNLPMPIVAVMLAGVAIGGASTVGVAEHAYTAGLSAGWYNGAWGTGGIVVGLFLAAKMRRMNLNTVPEMIGHMHGGSARFLGVVTQLMIMMTITSLQYVAGGAILAALLPEYFTLSTGMIFSAVTFIGITVIGGYWASGLSNVINVIVIYVGVIAALYAGFNQAGGFEKVVSALPSDGVWFDPVKGVGFGILFGWIAVMITQAATTQGVIQIALAAKDEKAAKWGFILGGIIILPIGFLCSMFGVLAAVQFPGLEKATLALPSIAANISPLVGGIFLAGLWAADVSTAVGLLMGCSMLIMQDVVKKILPEKTIQKNELLISRVCVLLVSLCSLWLAFNVVGILRTLTSALALTTSFTLLIAANLYLPHLCRRAAGFWVLLASLVVWACWTWIPATRVGPHLIYLEWVVCLAVFALFTFFSKTKATDLPR